jgi:hypothetical protein
MSTGYVMYKDRMDKSELESILQEAIMTYFTALSQHVWRG